MSILAKPTISPLKICRFENETLKVSLSYDLAFNSKKLTVGKSIFGRRETAIFQNGTVLEGMVAPPSPFPFFHSLTRCV